MPVRTARLLFAASIAIIGFGGAPGGSGGAAADDQAPAATTTLVSYDALPVETPAANTTTAVLKLQAIVAAGAKPIKDPIVWTVVRPDGNGQPAAAVARQTKSEPTIKLPPGSYIVEANWNGMRSQRSVDLIAGKPSTQVFNFNTGTVKIKMIPYTGAAVVATPVQWDIYPHKKGNGGHLDPATRVASVSAPQQEFVLPAGQYIFRASYNGTTADLVVPVEAGHSYKYTINLYAATVKFSPVGAKGDDIVWSVFKQKPDANGNRVLVQTQTGNSPSMLLREGNYIVAARQGNKAGEAMLAVSAGTNPKVKVTLQ
jgi:hypothetical protein